MKQLFVLLLLLSTMALNADDYRTIQRNTTVKANNGETHKVGDFGNYYALLIYVEEYKHLNNLTTPKKDVEDIAKILKNRYGFVESKIIPNPKSRDDLIEILDGFKNRLNKNDNLLIYYAGHGSKGGYWQLSNAKKHTRYGWILIKEAINKTLKEMNSQHILVIADSCYSGVLTRSGVDENILDPNDREYFSKLYKIKSRNVLTSGGFEPVLDKDPTNPNHSVFANGLLKMLKDNNRLIFSLEEKYKEVESYVEENSHKKQTPLYSQVKGTGYEKGGDFIFLDKKSIAQRIEKEKNRLYALTIERTPSDATVQILHIKPRYKDGIMLKEGRYEIRVFADGYKEKRFFVKLEDTLNYRVELESLSNEKNESKVQEDSKTNFMDSTNYKIIRTILIGISIILINFYFFGNISNIFFIGLILIVFSALTSYEEVFHKKPNLFWIGVYLVNMLFIFWQPKFIKKYFE